MTLLYPHYPSFTPISTSTGTPLRPPSAFVGPLVPTAELLLEPLHPLVSWPRRVQQKFSCDKSWGDLRSTLCELNIANWKITILLVGKLTLNFQFQQLCYVKLPEGKCIREAIQELPGNPCTTFKDHIKPQPTLDLSPPNHRCRIYCSSKNHKRLLKLKHQQTPARTISIPAPIPSASW